MGTDQIMYCIVALILGMLLANMLKNVCGCKVVEGKTAIDLVCDRRSSTTSTTTVDCVNNCRCAVPGEVPTSVPPPAPVDCVASCGYNSDEDIDKQIGCEPYFRGNFQPIPDEDIDEQIGCEPYFKN